MNHTIANKYAALSTEEFDQRLRAIVETMDRGAILDIPGVYELVSEHLNNDVLESWENDNVDGYRSIAVWPPGTVSDQNDESSDDHATQEEAEAVCRMLRREGFGGRGAVYPISTRVGVILRTATQ